MSALGAVPPPAVQSWSAVGVAVAGAVAHAALAGAGPPIEDPPPYPPAPVLPPLELPGELIGQPEDDVVDPAGQVLPEGAGRGQARQEREVEDGGSGEAQQSAVAQGRVGPAAAPAAPADPATRQVAKGCSLLSTARPDIHLPV